MYLADSMAVTTIPVTDLEQTKSFYRDILGLMLLEETPFAIRWGAGQTQISTYKRPPIERGHTTCHFEVADIEAAVAELKARGAVFGSTPAVR